ncbi:DUF3224 domain-containing protein [Tessaracoccus sp. SD287]|uniref:DUF3224 domain-containing protein n=1 Tax=Tessaracoccus sp. SD287 TaxID=2782008 RepID=UPI001A95E6DA|nr:DUF3224 domain-containing protein [Tessaracoccus sp. SD287]MBO1030546.1 DUF3224 domain-containing protein [Tessaracoccus sp. SD287]
MDLIRTAAGTFTIEMSAPSTALDGAVDKFGLTKTWSGDIRGTSTGIMLAGGDPATGDAGYVAIEVVRADLGGREGTFLLQQFGDLDRSAETLYYQVVSGSGTGGLVGLRGTMDLDIDDVGVHHYELTYTLTP